MIATIPTPWLCIGAAQLLLFLFLMQRDDLRETLYRAGPVTSVFGLLFALVFWPVTMIVFAFRVIIVIRGGKP